MYVTHRDTWKEKPQQKPDTTHSKYMNCFRYMYYVYHTKMTEYLCRTR